MVLFADTNVLIDLYKVGLLEEFFLLGEKICMEETVFEEELIKPAEIKKMLLGYGLNCISMNDEEFNLARQVYEENPKLSFYDSVAFAVSKMRGWGLLTGDKRLRKYAEKNGVCVHGLLWIMDECARNGMDNKKYFRAARIALNDKRIHIPENAMRKRILGYSMKLYHQKMRRKSRDYYIWNGNEMILIECYDMS